jgi:hypothetical protein
MHEIVLWVCVVYPHIEKATVLVFVEKQRILLLKESSCFMGKTFFRYCTGVQTRAPIVMVDLSYPNNMHGIGCIEAS